MKWLKWILIVGIALTAIWLIYGRAEKIEEPFDEKNGVNVGKIRDKMRNRTLI